MRRQERRARVPEIHVGPPIGDAAPPGDWRQE
jgi:hypothetical protein